MRGKALILGVVLCMLLGACSPFVMSYDHVCFEEANGLVILERSASSTDSQGKPLRFAKTRLPLKAQLRRDDYLVEIDTPANPMPVVFLNVRTLRGERLKLRGGNIHLVYPTVNDYSHSFHVHEACGEPLTFEVLDSSGRVLGHERLEYRVRTRGFSYGIEAI